jgi:peptidoglycan/LPS O-acetylase OafA/YrhL
MALALVHERGRLPTGRWTVALAVVGLIVVAWGTSLATAVLWDLPTAFGASLLVAAMINVSLPASLARVGTFLALLTYSFYLWHLEVIHAIVRMGGTGAAGAFLALGLSILIAAAIYFLAESPVLRAARRRFPSSAGDYRRPAEVQLGQPVAVELA